MSPRPSREVLLEDPLRPGFAAVVRSGTLLFLSSIDGVVDHRTGEVLPGVFGDGPAQARNAYSALVDRLVECGYDGSAAVRIEHATSSQEWRLARMALWPEHFGEPTQAVSQGYQGKMAGRNMITVTAVATTPDAPREIIVPGPNSGRASRISRCGDFLFVIGVRGEESLETGERAAEEVPGAFEQQVRFSYGNLAHHLRRGGADLRDVVRFDGFVRNVNVIPQHDAVARECVGGDGAAFTVVGCPLGGATDLEVSAIAVAPGVPKPAQPIGVGGCTTRAGGLVFTSGVLGDVDDEGNPQRGVYGDLEGQLDVALRRIARALDAQGAQLADALRLDVYLPDPYQSDRVDALLRDRFGGDVPAVARHGVELGPTGLIGLTAIAADRTVTG